MKLYDKILEEYKILETDIILSKTFDKDSKNDYLSTVIIPVFANLFIFFNPRGGEVEILYSPSTNKNEVDKMISLIKKHFNEATKLGTIFLLLHKDDSGYHLNPYQINNPLIDISKHYNDDFAEINNIIINRLNTKNDKGLVLLHGKSGTGKTSYIRYLTTQIKKRLIFLSPDIAQRISSPDFLTVLSEYEDAILIIEDAENVIEMRKGGGSSAISNLLNLTDGLLADCLKIQVVCTFNTDVTNIDKALLRKGRLIAKYKFTELEQSKAQALSNQLGFTSTINENTLIADIFNQTEISYQKNKSNKIGFQIKK